MDVKCVGSRSVSITVQARRLEPVTRLEDALTVCLDPRPGLFETRLHDLEHGAVVPRSNVEEEVAVFTDYADDVLAGQVLGIWGLVVEAIRKGVHAAARSPFLGNRARIRRVPAR